VKLTDANNWQIMSNNSCRLSSVIFFALLLSACTRGGLLTTVGPDYNSPSLPVDVRWQAAQPTAHQGDPAILSRWWDNFHDSALSRFLAAAQQQSASVANANARIQQARANLAGAEASLLPSLDSSLSSKRSSSSFGGPTFVWTQYQIGLQSSWELDLFGGLARREEAALSQVQSRNASWHDARVAVAAEVANAYLAYRYCEIQLQQLKAEAVSRQESARLAKIAEQNGFRALADTALANASASQGNSSLLAQLGQCERSIKGLVAMTGLAETDARKILADGQAAKLPKPAFFKLDSLPARVLRQRPDIAAAERDLAEASANIGVEQAKRFPKLSLSGNITPTLQNINGAALMLAQTWAIGPTLSLPLFDAGKRAADVEVAKAQYLAAESSFKSKVRTAVKEVEEALVRLASSEQRLPLTRNSASDFQTHFIAAQQLYQAGLGNLIDLEASRRNTLSAETAVHELEQERVSAWIALYRAAGGGWEADSVENVPQLETGNPQQFSKPERNGKNDLKSPTR
jgi:NodT family efflux transporter outer membrane factor (OMF) lipoprotein